MRLYEALFRMTPNGYRKWIKKMLNYADFMILPENYVGFSIIYGVLLFVTLLLTGLIIHMKFFVLIAFFVPAVFEAFMHAVPIVIADSRAKFMEEILPDALNLISSNIRSGLTPDQALLLSARPEFGPLEKQIRRSAKLMLSGESIEDAVQTIPENIYSKTLKRTVDLLVEGIAKGGSLANLLDGLANDIRQTRILKKEVQAFVMMYAIFIFFAAGIGAPLLYGISSYLVETMQKVGSTTPVQRTFTGGSRFMTFQAIQINQEFMRMYMLASLGITSFFGALLIGLIQGGSEKAGLKYIPVLALLSVSIYFLSRFIVISALGTII
ncbi:MAG: type II secretion system F family protein [Candidatus Aenigmarchaeota archaeon]|nr:type II secretion system F family protein [Candidatus Aenigmarchaeota archaeon]